MSEITTLQPSLLWKWFDQICAILILLIMKMR